MVVVLLWPVKEYFYLPMCVLCKMSAVSENLLPFGNQATHCGLGTTHFVIKIIKVKAVLPDIQQ